MFKNFELCEFLESETARRRRIDNTPSFLVVSHLEEVTSVFLQPLRDKWGKAITITSGFRCPALNRAAGGVSNSAHLDGYGVDFISEDFENFCAFCKDFVLESKINFDQLIIEKDSKGSRWLHFSLMGKNGQQRGQIFNLEVE